MKGGGPVLKTHCHTCGGFMSYRKRVSYRLPSAATPRATAHRGLCSCNVSRLDGPPPGYASIPAMPSVPNRPTPLGPSRPPFRKNVKM